MTRFSLATWALVGMAAVLQADEPARAEKSTHQPAPTTVGAPALPDGSETADTVTNTATDAAAATETEAPNASTTPPDTDQNPPDQNPAEDGATPVETQKVDLTAAEWRQQFDALQKRITALEMQLVELRNRQGDVETLRDKVLQLEEQNRQLVAKLDEMQPPADGTQSAAGASPELRRALKINAQVRLHNWVGDGARININGTWHTLRSGVNSIPVHYGPVTMHRWENGTPRFFQDWKTSDDGFVMEFDVGVPPAKSSQRSDWH